MNTELKNEGGKFGKVTMYFIGHFGMGMRKVEAKECSIKIAPYAQYQKAVHVEFKAPRQRLTRTFEQGFRPTLLVLEGWGHPDPGEKFTPPVDVGGGATVSQSLYTAFSPRWETDFNAQIAAYIAQSGAKVVADFRGHDPEERHHVRVAV